MSQYRTVGRDEWLAARKEFLVKEKVVTRARDALNAQRRELPMMVIDKEYVFEGPEGKLNLLDLFGGRRQLLTYHFMWPLDGVEWCPICSFWIDNMGHQAHMHARDTERVIVCAAPQSKIVPFKQRMGWHIPWYTTEGDDFYRDFALDADADANDLPGVSAFLRDGDRVLYAYSTYSRGSDILNSTYNYLDLTPLGRQEEGSLADKLSWVRHHDSYEDSDSGAACHG